MPDFGCGEFLLHLLHDCWAKGKIRTKTKWNLRGFNIWHFTVDDCEI